MAGIGSKCRSLGLVLVKTCLFFTQSSSNLLRMFVLMISRSSLINGAMWSKTRSNLGKGLLANYWTKFFPQSSNTNHVHDTSVYQVSDLGPSLAACYIFERKGVFMFVACFERVKRYEGSGLAN